MDRFSRSFHKMKGVCANFLDPDLFFDSFRDVAVVTNFGQNLQTDLYSTCRHFHNGFKYMQFRFRGDKGHNSYNFGEGLSTNAKDLAGVSVGLPSFIMLAF